MKLENQVCSLELAKRLKELGVKQESLFYFYKPKDQIPFIGEPDGVENVWGTSPYGLPEQLASAFTVAELGEMLPRDTQSWLSETEAVCYYKSHEQTADTEANARAKLLIYLIENDLYKPTY